MLNTTGKKRALGLELNFNDSGEILQVLALSLRHPFALLALLLPGASKTKLLPFLSLVLPITSTSSLFLSCDSQMASRIPSLPL